MADCFCATLATWCKKLTHWKRPWYWERLKVGGEGEDRGWDGWTASPTQWTWVWVSSGSWLWTGKPSILQSMGSQSRTQLSNWTDWHCHRSWSLKINYVTQLLAFQPRHQLKALCGGFLCFKERTFFSSGNTFTNNNHVWHLFLIWWHLTILRWTGITYCTLTMDIMWLNFDNVLTWFNDYFALHL